MVSKPLRKMLIAASAPFDDNALDAMDDGQAYEWLDRNSDDPLIFHGCHDQEGRPIFIGPSQNHEESDPFTWFHDAEVTYVAVRTLLAADDNVHCFHALCFHLCQQVIEKGAKSILALQYMPNANEFKPRKFNHSSIQAINAIATSFLPAKKASRMRAVAEVFSVGHFVGKYEVDTGGGLCMGLDHMRPVDGYMKIVYDVFKPKLAPRKASFIDRVASGTGFGVSLPRSGIRLKNIRLALMWRNPLFFPDWENACRRLREITNE